MSFVVGWSPLRRVIAVSWFRKQACTGLCVLAGVLLGVPHRAAAHEQLMAVIQHHALLSVGAGHVDLTVELTFFEMWSMHERRVMDGDADGCITRAELNAYLKKLAPALAGEVTLRISGREVPLVPLYDPEVELLGNEKVIPGHHRLRLFFFVPTPPTLCVNDEFSIEDRLWPEAEALATVTTEGLDGCVLEAEPPQAPDSSEPRRSEEAVLFKVRCRQPPRTQSASPHPAKTDSTNSPIGALSVPQDHSNLLFSTLP